MIQFFRNIFFTKRFFRSGIIIAFLFALSYVFVFLFNLVLLASICFIAIVLIDMVTVFTMKRPLLVRELADRWSNGDENSVTLVVKNPGWQQVFLTIIDEVPDQFEAREFKIKTILKPGARTSLEYSLTPLTRGEYFFDVINLFLMTRLRLVERRIVYDAKKRVEVYPSFHSFKLGLLTSAPSAFYGSAPLRKLGHSMEFEQISEYVSGDDVRNLNWKATARRGTLMVNNYTDEKSQQVYCIIDKGRLMKMPFEGLSLLDHSINCCLRLVQTSLRRSDKVGLITFNTRVSSIIPPDKRPVQRDKILQALYKEETDFKESDFEMLYMQVRKHVKGRSLIILFTNFETLEGLYRQLPYLRSLAKFHLLLVVFFENTEVIGLANSEVRNVDDVYRKTIAGQFVHEKRLIARELNRHGILTILTSPSLLTINVINKYLELKNRQAV